MSLHRMCIQTTKKLKTTSFHISHLPVIIMKILCVTLTKTLCFVLAIKALIKSSTAIQMKNLRSYGALSTRHATNCLATLSDYYFRDSEKSEIQNIVVTYTGNLSIPADNIQLSYLKWIHQAIITGDMDK